VLGQWLAFAILLSVPAQPADAPPDSLESQLNRTYLELMDLAPQWGYSAKEFRTLKARIEADREAQIDSAETLVDRWRKQIEAARDQLEQLNRLSSRDTEESARQRAALHSRIEGLEQSIRDAEIELEQTIPAAFEIRLAKLWLIKHWPERRQEVVRRIESGRARERAQGDVEDIGYRSFVEGQDEDIAAGEAAARRMMAEGLIPGELQDPAVEEYIRWLAGRIASNSDLRIPLHVTVLDSSEIHPITLPGGYLFLSSGLIRTARSESELAGVIAREIGRIAARHGERASKPPLFSRILTPVLQIAAGLFTGGASPGAYYGISYGVQGLGALVDRALDGRPGEYQREADRLGVQYAWKAGFDPRGFISFLDAVTADERSRRSGPRADAEPEDLGRRLAAAFSEITYLPAGSNAAADSPEFLAARRRLQTER
jgi:hypothetical protein